MGLGEDRRGEMRQFGPLFTKRGCGGGGSSIDIVCEPLGPNLSPPSIVARARPHEPRGGENGPGEESVTVTRAHRNCGYARACMSKTYETNEKKNEKNGRKIRRTKGVCIPIAARKQA